MNRCPSGVGTLFLYFQATKELNQQTHRFLLGLPSKMIDLAYLQPTSAKDPIRKQKIERLINACISEMECSFVFGFQTKMLINQTFLFPQQTDHWNKSHVLFGNFIFILLLDQQKASRPIQNPVATLPLGSCFFAFLFCCCFSFCDPNCVCLKELELQTIGLHGDPLEITITRTGGFLTLACYPFLLQITCLAGHSCFQSVSLLLNSQPTSEQSEVHIAKHASLERLCHCAVLTAIQIVSFLDSVLCLKTNLRAFLNS